MHGLVQLILTVHPDRLSGISGFVECLHLPVDYRELLLSISTAVRACFFLTGSLTERPELRVKAVIFVLGLGGSEALV